MSSSCTRLRQKRSWGRFRRSDSVFPKGESSALRVQSREKIRVESIHLCDGTRPSDKVALVTFENHDILHYKMSLKSDPEPGHEAVQRTQMLKGLAELALLSLLDEEACYGLEILERLRSDAGLQLAEGAVYPLLHRLEKARWTAAEWRIDPENGRPRKYYVITDAGREELAAQRTSWAQLSSRLTHFLERSVRP